MKFVVSRHFEDTRNPEVIELWPLLAPNLTNTHLNIRILENAKRDGFMRTSIEISDKHRSTLLSLAAQKGLRGYSGIIQEALDYYIAHQTRTADVREKVLRMKGSWKEEETEQIKYRLADLRENWKKL